MSHRHWCPVAGHEWLCSGSAIRLFQNEPTPCFCLQHQTSMEDGDHSGCSIELIACPEHLRVQTIAMGHDPDQPWPEETKSNKESGLFQDKDGNRTVGFCLWCGRDFYTMEEHEAHIANYMAECEVFQKLKDETTVPPLLDELFEEGAAQGNPEEDDDEPVR